MERSEVTTLVISGQEKPYNNLPHFSYNVETAINIFYYFLM